MSIADFIDGQIVSILNLDEKVVVCSVKANKAQTSCTIIVDDDKFCTLPTCDYDQILSFVQWAILNNPLLPHITKAFNELPKHEKPIKDMSQDEKAFHGGKLYAFKRLSSVVCHPIFTQPNNTTDE